MYIHIYKQDDSHNDLWRRTLNMDVIKRCVSIFCTIDNRIYFDNCSIEDLTTFYQSCGSSKLGVVRVTQLKNQIKYKVINIEYIKNSLNRKCIAQNWHDRTKDTNMARMTRRRVFHLLRVVDVCIRIVVRIYKTFIMTEIF